MFVTAVEKAAGFTRPVIVSWRTAGGRVTSSLGAFVLLNAEGWFATAGHMFDVWAAKNAHDKLRAQRKAQRAAAEADPKLSGKRRRKALEKLEDDPDWITHHSHWFGALGSQAAMHIFPELDLAVGKLQTTPPPFEAPVLRDPATIKPGTSLCRFGYPFVPIACTFDESRSHFDLNAPGGLPFFPNEGIYTRDQIGGRTKDGKFELAFLETSCPGLPGQSGGPLVDKEGRLCGIQSSTASLPLGFLPKVNDGKGKEVEVPQFLNVGWAVHPRVLTAVLTSLGVSFASS